MAMSQSERDELAFKLSQNFKPATPINREDLFSGRVAQTRDVVAAINQNGQHVVLYGERGVGKTSLANMIMYKLRCPGRQIITPHINCASGHTFSDIWGAVFDDICFRAERLKIQIPKPARSLLEECDAGLRNPITQELVRRIVSALADKDMIVIAIIDEFDVLTDPAARVAVAESLKFFSDRNVPVTVALIGVSDDVESLITEHQSVERCIVQVRMPRMSRDEIEEIVVSSLTASGMKIDKAGLHEISRLAKGLPHYAHLLGLHSGYRTLDVGSKAVSQASVSAAISSAVDKAQVTIRNSYLRATTSTKKNALYKEVLLACALTEPDELGYFSPSDVRAPLARVLKRDLGVEGFARHLHAFCKEDRGPVLRILDIPNRPRFRFENALMQPYVVMRGIKDKIITEDDLKETRDPSDPQGRLF